MTHYVGILDGAGDVWGVRFPDIPGCVSAGATAEEAVANAVAALRDVVIYKRASGVALPTAGGIADILAAEPLEAGESAVMVPLLADAGRPVRANVSFDAGLLAAIDEAAEQRGITRSAFLASAAREKIERFG